MASGQVMESEAMWEGMVEVEGVQAQGVFEVFDSGGGWEFLFGKPLQMTFAAVHNYKWDMVDIKAAGKRVMQRPMVEELQATGRKWHACGLHGGCFIRERPCEAKTIQEDSEGEEREEAEAEQSDLYNTNAYTMHPAESIFTRALDPFNPKCVECVVEAVTIGPDLTEAQQQEV
ncbi:hypothetical protein DFH08DRAFT_976412 [Mycena albidolilacea]|uniref:Uncharacterized protein n=1 Tax=Mycena albidolilacea TaxID=1033008 RepID=A0AAD7E9K3_9AGAR|nr:hypothetical protein DFH08DRAFT_976412 [Mycena albidolilacea]